MASERRPQPNWDLVALHEHWKRAISESLPEGWAFILLMAPASGDDGLPLLGASGPGAIITDMNRESWVRVLKSAAALIEDAR